MRILPINFSFHLYDTIPYIQSYLHSSKTFTMVCGYLAFEYRVIDRQAFNTMNISHLLDYSYTDDLKNYRY